MASSDGQNNYVDRWERTLGDDSDSVIHRRTIIRTRESPNQTRLVATSTGLDSKTTDELPRNVSEHTGIDHNVAESGARYVDRWEQVITVDPHEINTGARVLVSKRHPIHSFKTFTIYPSQVSHSHNIGLKESDSRDHTYIYGERRESGESHNEDVEEESGGAQIIRKMERSFSIDEDGRKSGYSSRLLERRKTIEVDKDDLSGIEALHTSYFDFNIGSGRDQDQQGDKSMKSEVNIVWGKTIDADEMSSPRESERSFRSEMQFSPRMNRSLDDSTDYWSADMDMSSDTVMTSDSYNTFVETGDSLYTSDSNDSFIERHELSSCDASVDAKSFTVWRDGENQSTGLPFRSDNELVFSAASDTDGNFHLNPEITHETKKPSEQNTGGSERKDSRYDSKNTLQSDKSALFKVSDTIAVLGRGGIPFTDTTRVDNEKYMLSGDNSEHKEWKPEFPYSDSGDQSDADTNDGDDAQQRILSPDDTRNIQPEGDSTLEVGHRTEILSSEVLDDASLRQTSDATDDRFNPSVGDLDAINNNETVVSERISQEGIGDGRTEDCATAIIRGGGLSTWRTVDIASGMTFGVNVNDRPEEREGVTRSLDQGSTNEDTHITVESSSRIQMPEAGDDTGLAATVDKAAEETEFVPVRSKKKKKKKGKKKKQKAAVEDEPADREVEKVEPADREVEEVEPADREVEEVEPADREVEVVEPADREVEEVDPADREVEEVEPTDTTGSVLDTQQDTTVTDSRKSVVASGGTDARVSKYAKDTEWHDEDVDLSNITESVLVDRRDDADGVDSETVSREDVYEPDYSTVDTANINVSTDTIQVGDSVSLANEGEPTEDHPQPVDSSIMALGGPDDVIAVCEPDDSSVDVSDIVVSGDALEIADATPEIPELGETSDVAPVTSDDHEAERLSNERTEAEEFIAKILDETDAQSSEHGHEFLHSDEPSGVLLNLYTGGHRRILKPHRRYTRPPEESSSVDEKAPVAPTEDAQKDSDRSEGTSVDVIPPDSTATVDTDIKDANLDEKGGSKKKKRGKARKRKRDGTSRQEVPSDDEDSELNISGESGSVDISFEETGDVDEEEKKEQENASLFDDQRNTLSDELEQTQVEDDDSGDNMKGNYMSTEPGGDYLVTELSTVVAQKDTDLLVIGESGAKLDFRTQDSVESEESEDLKYREEDMAAVLGDGFGRDDNGRGEDIFPSVEREDSMDEPTEITSEDNTSYDIGDLKDDLIDASDELSFTDHEEKGTVEHESEIDRVEDIIVADPAEYIVIIKTPSFYRKMASLWESVVVEHSPVITEAKETQVEAVDKNVTETDIETTEDVIEEYKEYGGRDEGPYRKDTDENAELESDNEDGKVEKVIEDSGEVREMPGLVDTEKTKLDVESYVRELKDEPLAGERIYHEMQDAESDQQHFIQRGDFDSEQSLESVEEQRGQEGENGANYLVSTERETDRMEEFSGEPVPEKATIYRRMSSKTYNEDVLISKESSMMVVEHSDLVVVDAVNKNEEDDEINREEESLLPVATEDLRTNETAGGSDERKDSDDTEIVKEEEDEDNTGNIRVELEEEESGEESDIEDEGEDDTIPRNWDDFVIGENDGDTDVLKTDDESQVIYGTGDFDIEEVDNAAGEDIEYDEEENMSETWEKEEGVCDKWEEEAEEGKELGDVTASKEVDVEELMYQEDKFLTGEQERQTDRSEQFIDQIAVDTITFFRPESAGRGDHVAPVAWIDQPEVLPGIVFDGSHTEKECLITGIREEVAGDDNDQDREETYNDEEESRDISRARSENKDIQERVENVVDDGDWGAVGDKIEMKDIEADLVEMIDNDEESDGNDYDIDLFSDRGKERTVGSSEYTQKEVKSVSVVQDNEEWTDSTAMQDIEETLTGLIDEHEDKDPFDSKEVEDTKDSDNAGDEDEDALKRDITTEKDEELENLTGMRDIAEKIVEMIEEDEENEAAGADLNDEDKIEISEEEKKDTELDTAMAMSELNYLREDVTRMGITEERLVQMAEDNKIWERKDDEKNQQEKTITNISDGGVAENVDENLEILKEKAEDSEGNVSITRERTEITEEDEIVDEERDVFEREDGDITTSSEDKEIQETTPADINEGGLYEIQRQESEIDRAEEFLDMVEAESIHFSRSSGSVADHVIEREDNTIYVEISDDVTVTTKKLSDTEDVENENIDIYKGVGYDDMEDGYGEDDRYEEEKELDRWEGSEEWEDEMKVSEELVTEDVDDGENVSMVEYRNEGRDLYDRNDERKTVEEYEDNEVDITETRDDEANVEERDDSDKETHSVTETDRTQEDVDDEETDTVRLLRFRSFDDEKEEKLSEENIVDVGRSENERVDLSSVSEADTFLEPERETDRLEEFLDTRVVERISVVKEQQDNLMFMEQSEVVLDEMAGEEVEEEEDDIKPREIEREVKRYTDEEDGDVQIYEKNEVSAEKSGDRDADYRVDDDDDDDDGSKKAPKDVHYVDTTTEKTASGGAEDNKVEEVQSESKKKKKKKKKKDKKKRKEYEGETSAARNRKEQLVEKVHVAEGVEGELTSQEVTVGIDVTNSDSATVDYSEDKVQEEDGETVEMSKETEMYVAEEGIPDDQKSVETGDIDAQYERVRETEGNELEWEDKEVWSKEYTEVVGDNVAVSKEETVLVGEEVEEKKEECLDIGAVDDDSVAEGKVVQTVENADVTEEKVEIADVTGENVETADVTEENVEITGVTGEDVETTDITEEDVKIADVMGEDIEIADITEEDVEIADVTGEDIKNADMIEEDVVTAGLTEEDIENVGVREDVDKNLDLETDEHERTLLPEPLDTQDDSNDGADLKEEGVGDEGDENRDDWKEEPKYMETSEGMKSEEIVSIIKSEDRTTYFEEYSVESGQEFLRDNAEDGRIDHGDFEKVQSNDLIESQGDDDIPQSLHSEEKEDRLTVERETSPEENVPEIWKESNLTVEDSETRNNEGDSVNTELSTASTDNVSFVSPEEEATPILATGENTLEKSTESKKKKKKKKRDKKKDKARQEESAVPLHDSDKTPEPSACQTERSMSELPGDAQTSESVNEMREVEGAEVQVEEVQISGDDIGSNKEVDLPPVVTGVTVAGVSDDSDMRNVSETRTVLVVDSGSTNNQTEQLPCVCIDRHEEFLQDYIPTTITRRLLEDVVSNRARAEEVIAQNPEASGGHVIHDSSSSSGEATLTPAGRLMSEMSLLETAARDQWGSLQLAVSGQEKYEEEIRHYTTAISEAQQKLQASPEMATSVGALKQQMAEHNVSLEPESRERSSSFGADVGPVGRPLGQAHADDRVRELDVSWNTLQQQGQSKERELQATLQRQERYQLTIQEVTAKMERAHIRLAYSPAAVAAPLDVQMKDYQDTLVEIENIKADIAKARDMGQQLMDTPSAEGHKAMEATLTMLADRFDNLQAMAEDKGRQLQEAMKNKEKHSIAEKAYKKRVQDLQDWLEEKKVRQASITLPSEDPVTLQTQLDENREIQEEINNHLRQVSDLALQCDSLCENETPINAEKLRNELATLQSDLGQFKIVTIEKQSQLRAAIKDAEKRRKERAEHDSNVQRLQKWMSDTKELTMASGSQATAIAPGQRDIHKELATDISKHRQLVRQISGHKLRTATSTTASDQEVRESWERLSRDLAQKKQNLETVLKSRKPGDRVQISLHAPARHADSARQLEEVKSVMSEMGDCWNQLQMQLDEKQLQLDEALTFQQQYQSALQNVSSWLDLAQQQLFTVPSTTEEHIRQNENLQRQIRSLQGEVSSMSEQAEDLLAATNSATKDLIEKCLGSLNDRVKLLEDTAKSQAEDLQRAERQWKQYQDEVAELQRRLQDTQKLVLAPASTQTLEQLMSNNQKIEAQLKKCETQLEELKGKESHLTQAYPKGVFPSELSTLQSNYMELHRRAMEKKATLQNTVSIQDQYQKMLKDYAVFVETGQEKLRNDSISARDLNHLKQQLAAHKDFFSDLEVHKAMLDSLAGQCDPTTRATFQQQHSSLSNLTHVLVDQASLHGQRLERLTRQWIELDEKYMRLIKVLSSLESQVPRPIVSGDSLTTIQDKLGKYKRLQSELADERNMVFDVVDRGKQILHSINCPTLETAITDLANKWVSLNTDLTHELKRTETLGDQLSVFETEAAVLTSWLNAAKMKLASFKQLSPSDLQHIGAIRTKVEKVLEFRKEVENQLPLKNRVITVGNQLLQNKNYDTRGLSDRLNGYELEWVQLEKGIAESQEFLHQAQMDLMPSRQALNELTSWIDEINQSLKQDANRRIKTVADIEIMLKKYKGYKIELASKQMTLDFVNQEVLAPHEDEVAVPHEKLDFAEKLGDLNKQWKKVVKDVNDRLDILEGLQSKWEKYEKALERLQTWFREQEDKIKRYKLIGQEVGVRQTQKDCKALHDQLQARQSDLDAIRKLGKHLIELSRESPGCQQSVKESLATLDENWRRLEEQTRQLEILLTDMLGQWARYHTDLAVLNKVITQTEYALNHYTLIGGDIATLRSQMEKLKALQAELNNHSGHLESFSALASQLRQVCEPPVQVEIQKTVSDIQTKFKQLKSDLAARCKQFESCLKQWQEFENQYHKIREWLDTKEILYTDLINMRDDPRRRPESLAKCNQLQQELDRVQGQISNLYRLSDQLTKNMNPSTIAIITHRQSTIEQRMLALRQILSQHTSTLTDDLSQQGRFNEAFEVVKKFLSYAEAILDPEDPTKAAEEIEIQSRLEQLKQLVLPFNTNYSKLDDVNDLGYRLALNEADATRLRDLNHKWQNLYEDACDRSRTLQGILLVMQDFTSKCEHWMTFLAQTEQDLAKEIKGNLRDLRDQLRKCEQFESDMYSRQQILHAIISDGQKMMRAGEVEDEEEFQQKLQLLAEQWQSVCRRANQRKVIIEGMISQWQQFNSLSKQLLDWLQDKEDAMRAYEFDSDSLQIIRSLIEKVQTTKHEFKLQEATFKKIHDLGNTLLQHADDRAADEVKDTLTELQRRWYQVFNHLDDHRSRLDGVDRQWLDCEDEIEDLLNWLKGIRSILHADIPTTYDEIQADMVRCRDISTDFMNAENKRQRLLAKEKQLGRMVQTEDMNLLHQRIRLLNKQWEELQHQTHIREQRLTEALFRWTNLGERLKSLMDWIDDMEIKVVSNRDMQVEDLLAKLENEYKRDMEEKEVVKDEIIEQGRQLMKVSSEIRASDIEQKLLRLEDKWNRLKGVMDFRLRKLQETVLAVKQLDVSMKNLSRWLSAVENELSGGLSFKDWGLKEIQAKLQDSQELQEDIERHSAGVSAVLNLCEVLLHDSDACPTETEFMALQHAMKNLEKRWRNICALSPERRSRVEETWELWKIFRADCQRFSDWLTRTELEVHDSEIEITDIKVAREEMRKYEDLQRNVHDHLSDLEHINRQYRQLAKEGRTDTDGSLKVKMTELNNRWDALQLRVTEIMKHLRHSPSIREDFETTRTSLITWLTEVDVQLTSLLQHSTYDLETKVTEIRRIEDEIHTKRHRMEYLDQAAVYLMQKGDSHEALTVQQELDEFRAYSKTVLDRVVTTQLYIERIVVAQVEDITTIFGDDDGASFRSAADRIREVRDAQATIELDRQTQELERYLEQSPPESPPVKHRPDSSPSRVSLSPSRRTSSPIRRAGSPVRRSQSPSPLRSRSPTRSAVVTTTGSTSPIRRFSPTPRRRSPSPTRRVVDVTDGGATPRHNLAQLERSAKIDVLMEQLVESLEETNIKLAALEKAMGPYGDSAHCVGLLMDCEVAVDDVLRLHRLLKIEAGHTTIATADSEVGLVQQRWERLQRKALAQENRTSQERHDLVKFANDIETMLIWLDEAEALQSTHRPSSSDIAHLNKIIRQNKDFLVQIEVKKATVVSINLLSKKYLSAKTAETRQLKGKLNEMNRRWELVLSRATRIQQELQTSLIQCQGFHHTISDYQLWLDAMETKVRHCEPINLSADESTLWEKYSILIDLQGELQCNQPKILSLKETADQLLISTESTEMSTARDKTYILYKRLRTLMHLTTSYISSLESKLQVVPPNRGSASSSFDLSEGRSSGLGSSHPSRSSTPLRSGPPSLRSRNRSPYAISRRLFSGIMGPLLRSGTQDRDNLSTEHEAAATVAPKVRPGLLMRVIRAALPIQLLLLLLLLLACLLPVCEDDYNCLLSNNLRHSISPMLRYTDGAPPT